MATPTILSKDSVKMLSGDLIPYFGFGTAVFRDQESVFTCIENGLAAGYRLIDTAQGYQNEQFIGDALKVLLPKYNLTRKDIFITSKFDTLRHFGEDVATHLDASLKKLGTDYLDLYLNHQPGIFHRTPESSPKTDAVLRDETWQQFVEAQKKGLVRNIGVSNYNVRHLTELLKNNHGVKPAVNQVKWNPASYNLELLNLCKSEGILLQAYSPLGGKFNSLVEAENIKKVAKKLNKTTAQVLLRWSLNQGVGVITKSNSRERLLANKDIDFNIPEDDMKSIFGTVQQPNDSKHNPDSIL